MMRPLAILSLAAVFLFLPRFSALAQEELAHPDVSIAADTEEGKKVLITTVKLDGKPLQGAQVSFFVRRSFGLILLGKDETLEDGTAAVPYPETLPAAPNGEFQLVVDVGGTSTYAVLRKVFQMQGGVKPAEEKNPFPRALWAPHAPIPLIVTIIGLLAIVWSAYTFVFVQLFKIHKEGTR